MQRMAALAILGRWQAASDDTRPVIRPVAEAAARELYRLAGLGAPRMAWATDPLAAGMMACQLDATPIAGSLLMLVLDRLAVLPCPIPLAQITRRYPLMPLDPANAFVLATALMNGEPFVPDPDRGHHAEIVLLHLRRLLADARRFDHGRVPGLGVFLRSAFAPVVPAVIDVLCAFAIAGADELAPFARLAESAGFVLPLDSVCILCERPALMSKDEWGRLHAEGGPAVLWPGGRLPMWRWHGREVAPYVVQPVERLVAPLVKRERNRIWQDIMIERYGLEQFIRDCRAEPVQQDATGELFVIRSGVTRRHVLTAVAVVNGTPEPDGTFRRYFLRVPPGIRTARAGVAWTYGMAAADYDVAVRT